MMRILLAMLAWLLGSCLSSVGAEPDKVAWPTDFGQPAKLPRPSDMTSAAFEAELLEFLNSRQYARLGWMVDKSVRDTGPYLNGRDYGTHPAVRIFYSPEIIQWLVDGRVADIPDGAVIVKEQFPAPAIRHAGLTEEQLWDVLGSWTVMVKDSKGSHDGWYWSNPAKGQATEDHFVYPFKEPVSGFGLYCVRCHASAQSPGKTNEFTFSSLRNIQGFPGQPLLFRVDDSWLPQLEDAEPDVSNEQKLASVAARPEAESKEAVLPIDRVGAAHPRCTDADYPVQCVPELNREFLALFPGVPSLARQRVQHLPPITYDSVPRRPGQEFKTPDAPHQGFVTSNQCMSCHAGLTEPFGPTMYIMTGDSKAYGEPGLHISPYGEWRWTPMGLSGRDPIFFAQLESELAYLEQRYEADTAHSMGRQLQKTCLGCHGVMGKRQHDIDVGEHAEDTFAIADVFRTELDPHSPEFVDAQYGALARDGVSCAVCHRMQPRPQPESDTRNYLEFFLETSITGNFYLGKPGEIYGPYRDDQLAPYIMNHAMGMKPKHSDYIQQSQMCGTCHTVNLPILDWGLEHKGEHNDLMSAEPNPAFRDFHHHVEQATYLEWLNSEFNNEINPENPKGKSCQDCHMSRGIVDKESGVNLPQIKTRVAVVQDNSYQDAEHLASHEDLNVRYRDQYSRHNFRGLNMFMLEMFRQFDDVLGVRKHDYMTGSKTDMDLAMRDFQRQAEQDTALLNVTSHWSGNQLIAEVEVTNLAGHRFPSGVGFRRAFIELLVQDVSRPSKEQIVWSSGRTNSLGLLVDHAGQPLPTEFFERDDHGNQQYQPHHTEINSSDQVQIYETLLHTRGGEFTTSFVHGCTIIKDNRFLPRGWTSQGPDGLKGHFLTATYPGPIATQDPRYQDGSGGDVVTYRIQLPQGVDASQVRVQASLFYQAIPPYFLKNIFDTSPNGPATQRLHYICGNLKLAGTPIEDWKLKVVSQTVSPLPPR